MRARSAKQRFPVAQWVEDLGILQSKSIEIHNKQALKNFKNPSAVALSDLLTPNHRMMGGSSSASSIHSMESSAEPILDSSSYGPGNARQLTKLRDANAPSPTSRHDSGHLISPIGTTFPMNRSSQLSIPTTIRSNRIKKTSRRSGSSVFSFGGSDDESDSESPLPPGAGRIYGLNSTSNLNLSTRSPSFEGRAADRDRTLLELQQEEILGMDPFESGRNTPIQRSFIPRPHSTLSLGSVVGERTDFELQAVDPFFTDATGQYGSNFQGMLEKLDGKTSEGPLCIEDFLKKSEKQWYNRFYDAKLGNSSTPSTPGFQIPWAMKSTASLPGHRGSMQEAESPPDSTHGDGFNNEEFGLDSHHVAPVGVLRLMQLKVGDWPVYAFILAFVSSMISQIMQ